jgi:hypothetical protein
MQLSLFLYGHILLDVSLQKNKLGDPPLIKFMIKDTGVGIKDDNYDELLKSSEKDKNDLEGGRLGLAISREIAKKLGKGLQFKSQYGIGTDFWFFIEAFEDTLKCTSYYKKSKSSKSIKKKSFSKFLETSKISINSDDEDICFTKNLKYFCLEEKRKKSNNDSHQTKVLDNYCLVKPSLDFNTNYLSSSFSEDKDQTKRSPRESNISNLSKNSNNLQRIFYQNKPTTNKQINSTTRLFSVIFYKYFNF